MKEPSIEITRLFKGHSSDVSSLDVHPSSQLLLSGSDDGTARIWDIRVSSSSSSSSQACCTTEGPVTAVAWDATDSGCFVATETILSWYDLRMKRVNKVFESMDEINQIVSCPLRFRPLIHKNKKKLRHKKKESTAVLQYPTMACADDAGQVTLWSLLEHETDSSTSQTNWQHCHTLSHAADTLVLSCALDEQSKYLVTGTSDCCVRLWSWTTGQLLSQFSVTTAVQPDQKHSQSYNPPMIHTLTWMPSSQFFVAGCGDGSLAVGNAQGVWLSRVDAAHGASVAACCPFGDSAWGCLASTGNDGRIVLWDMQSLLVSSSSSSHHHETKNTGQEESARDWLFGKSQRKHVDTRTSTDNSDTLTDAMETWSLTQVPETLLAWDHGTKDKPNDMVNHETSLFLADTSPDITLYTIRPGD